MTVLVIPEMARVARRYPGSRFAHGIDSD